MEHTLTPETNTEARQLDVVLDSEQPAGPRVIEAHPVAVIIDLTAPAGAAFYRQWERWNAQARPGCRRWTLQEFIAWRIEELALGPGVDDGAAADWLDRR